MPSRDPASPKDLERFREQLGELASADVKRLKNLNRANILVLISGTIGVVFFYAATFATRSQLSELREEKSTLEVAQKRLEREVGELNANAQSLRREVESLTEQRDDLVEWSDAYYGRLESAAEQDDDSAASILRSTPPPPGASPTNDARQLWREGQLAAQSGHFDTAEARYLQAIKINPRYSRALNSLGLLRHREKRVEEALDYYARAVDADPFYEPAIGNLANLQYQQGRVADAILWCSRGLKLDTPPKLIYYLQKRLSTAGYACTERDAGERFFRNGEHLVALGKTAEGFALVARGCALEEARACRFLETQCAKGRREACDLVSKDKSD